MRTPWSLAIGTLVLLIAGCDLPIGEAGDGPHVISITPSLTGTPIARDATFRIELDRRVTPSSAVDGVVEITSGDNYVWLAQHIDVVHPALIVTPLDPMDPDVNYGLRVRALRDFDGHASRELPRVLFHTSRALGTRAPPAAVPFAEVAPALAGCATSGCHAGSRAPLGLDLSSATAVRATAIGVPAREERSSVDGYLDTAVSAALLGLPRVDPGNPARSYLLYKMLGDPHIAGASMPPSGDASSSADLELVQRWIFAGASTD